MKKYFYILLTLLLTTILQACTWRPPVTQGSVEMLPRGTAAEQNQFMESGLGQE